MEVNKRSNKAAQLASDVLQILPIMSEIYQLAVTLKGKEITDDDKERMYKLSRELRRKSSEVSLLPTVEDELKDIDIEEPHNKFACLVREILPGAQVEVMEAERLTEQTLEEAKDR